MANVTVKKMQDWAISSRAPEMGKVQRLGLRPVEASASKHPAAGNGGRYSLISQETVSSDSQVIAGHGIMPVMTSNDLKQRFWAKVDSSSEDGCWNWTASVAGKGYGQIKLPGTRRQAYAHRLSYEFHNGPIPQGLMVLHRCDNPRCVRPDHLFLGTGADNLGDMAAKGRHLYGERNSKHRLTERQVHTIFDLSGAGLSQAKIAKEVGIGQPQVGRILRGERWHHVWLKRRSSSEAA